MEVENLEKRIAELERQIKIKDNYLKLIYDLGYDYDGFYEASSLRDLIDQLIEYSDQALNCDDTSKIYEDCYENNYNVLFEKIETKGVDKE